MHYWTDAVFATPDLHRLVVDAHIDMPLRICLRSDRSPGLSNYVNAVFTDVDKKIYKNSQSLQVDVPQHRVVVKEL